MSPMAPFDAEALALPRPIGGTTTFDEYTVEVRVALGDCQEHIVHVHPVILRSIPFFAAQLDRWTSPMDPLRVSLPEGVDLEALEQVLLQRYFECAALRPSSAKDALDRIKVATMLSCPDDSVASLVDLLRRRLRSVEDVDVVREFCETFGAPRQLAELQLEDGARRSEIFADEVIDQLLRCGLSGDEEILRLARQQLKLKSRCGPVALEEAAHVIAKHVHHTAAHEPRLSLALAFCEKYPVYFSLVVEHFFADLCVHLDAATQYNAELSCCCAEFLQLGVRHRCSDALSDDDLTVLMEALVKRRATFTVTSPNTSTPHAEPYQRSLLQLLPPSALTACLAPLDCSTQFRLWRVLRTEREDILVHLLSPSLLEVLGREAALAVDEWVCGLVTSEKVVAARSLFHALGHDAKMAVAGDLLTKPRAIDAPLRVVLLAFAHVPDSDDDPF